MKWADDVHPIDEPKQVPAGVLFAWFVPEERPLLLFAKRQDIVARLPAPLR
jgi:hypothetical protein